MADQKFQIGDCVVSKYAADKNRQYRVVYIPEITTSMLNTHTYQYCLEDKDHGLYIACEDDLLRNEDVRPHIEKCPICGSDPILQFGFSVHDIDRVRVHCNNIACGFSGPKLYF